MVLVQKEAFSIQKMGLKILVQKETIYRRLVEDFHLEPKVILVIPSELYKLSRVHLVILSPLERALLQRVTTIEALQWTLALLEVNFQLGSNIHKIQKNKSNFSLELIKISKKITKIPIASKQILIQKKIIKLKEARTLNPWHHLHVIRIQDLLQITI